MSNLRLIDNHSHTKYSPDSESSVLEMCKRAVDLGLLAYTVTDHCECESYTEDKFDVNIPLSVEETLKCRKLLGDTNTKILTGVEVGQALQNLPAAEEVVGKEYDFVIGSLHHIRTLPDFYFVDYTPYTMEELNGFLEDYYKEIYQMVLWGKFDTLAHLTYPLRYMIGEYGIPVDVKKQDDIIRDIFKELARRDIALEINTSGLRQKIGSLLPDSYYLKMFYDLGGKYITLGADAHRPEDVAKGIAEGMAAAADAGFSKVVYFEKRKPVPVELW